MKQVLQDKLFKNHCRIFQQKDLPINQVTMRCSISIGDGWYNIIDALCENIQHHLDWHNAEGPFERTKNHLKKDHEPIMPVRAIQIKEKFGGLRFYYRGGDDYISGLVAMAEVVSDWTCEECGNPGSQNKTGWIRTLCESCRAFLPVTVISTPVKEK